MLVVVAAQDGRIIFWKTGTTKKALEYLLAYSALDTEECLSVDGCVSTTSVLESGHKVVVISSGKEEAIAAQVSNLLRKEMLDPFVDWNVGLSERFSGAVELP